MIGTAHDSYLRATLLGMVMLAAAALVALVGASLAREAFPHEAVPDGHVPIAFEKDGEILVATKITPDTADSREVEPAVSPDGRKVAFASDRDGDFEIYMANVSTGEAQRVTDNAVDDRNPAWSPDGQWISYQAPHYSSPTHSGIFSAKV